MINEKDLPNIPPIEEYRPGQHPCDGGHHGMAAEAVRFESIKGCVVFMLCTDCVTKLRGYVVENFNPARK